MLVRGNIKWRWSPSKTDADQPLLLNIATVMCTTNRSETKNSIMEHH